MPISEKKYSVGVFSTPPASWKTRPVSLLPSPSQSPMSERKYRSPTLSSKPDLFHIVHKVPSGDSPYVRAKHVQLIDKEPSKSISLFWSAINSGDRVDSALKDMAVVMKQLNRSEEAIEAIKSFRHLCPPESQESLDNLLVELYKRSGRIEEEIEMLKHKLKCVEENMAFGGKRTKIARSQGKKIQITVDQERSRIMGNLAWAYLQQFNYGKAEELYRKALTLELDKNKQCNLAVCLMHMNRTAEAKSLLHTIKLSYKDGEWEESFSKSFDRAFQMLTELDSSSVSTSTNWVEEDHSKKPTEFESPFHSKESWVSLPSPNRATPNAPMTEPRRVSAWNVSDRDQRSRIFWKNGEPRTISSKTDEESVSVPISTDRLEDHSNKQIDSESTLYSKESWVSLPSLNKPIPKAPMTEPRRGSGWYVCDGDQRRMISWKNGEPKTVEEPVSANSKPIQYAKKSWADMVEEEEHEVIGRTDLTNKTLNEKMNSNKPCVTPCLQNQINNLTVSDQGNVNLGNSIPARNSSARRALCFDNQQKTDPVECFSSSSSSSPLSTNRVLEDETKKLSGEKYATPMRRNRLQVFENITLST